MALFGRASLDKCSAADTSPPFLGAASLPSCALAPARRPPATDFAGGRPRHLPCYIRCDTRVTPGDVTRGGTCVESQTGDKRHRSACLRARTQCAGVDVIRLGCHPSPPLARHPRRVTTTPAYEVRCPVTSTRFAGAGSMDGTLVLFAYIAGTSTDVA